MESILTRATTALRPIEQDELEITVIGPGYGESTVIHVGGGDWLLVDSLGRQSRRSQHRTLEYLTLIGVDPATAVKWIVATHWHDDHIRDLEELVRACHCSQLVVPSLLENVEAMEALKEFVPRLPPFEALDDDPTRETPEFSNGVQSVTSAVAAHEWAHENVAPRPKILYAKALDPLEDPSASSWQRHIVAMSPSQAQHNKGLDDLITSIRRAIDRKLAWVKGPDPNHASVVMWVQVRGVDILLGADMVHQARSDLGWQAVASAHERSPFGRGEVVKVPHHGGFSGHDEIMWTKLLEPRPIALLAPYERGNNKLPDSDDVERLLGDAAAVGQTAAHRRERIHSSGHRTRRPGPPGRITLRTRLPTPGTTQVAAWEYWLEGTAFFH